jgi:hypothetical protein
MLYQMALHTQEDFRAAQLLVCPKAPEYFNVNCKHLVVWYSCRRSFVNFLRPTQEESGYLQLAYHGPILRAEDSFRRGSYSDSKLDRTVFAPTSGAPAHRC